MGDATGDTVAVRPIQCLRRLIWLSLSVSDRLGQRDEFFHAWKGLGERPDRFFGSRFIGFRLVGGGLCVLHLARVNRGCDLGFRVGRLSWQNLVLKGWFVDRVGYPSGSRLLSRPGPGPPTGRWRGIPPYRRRGRGWLRLWFVFLGGSGESL
jgi:hypothetical protein